ncbi:hypothetical protein [Roseisolibacter agri]|nr:hypothetical protein [Roseisolibacter agri]
MADIAQRVRPTVPTMPQDQFDVMVQRMAEVEMRYAEAARAEARAAAAAALRLLNPRD